MPTSQFNIQGLIQPIQSGAKKIGPLVIANPTKDIGGITIVSLAAAATTAVAIPTGAIAALIVPNTTSTATIAMKTSLNSGDTGCPLSPNLPSLYTFPATPPTTLSFIVGAGGTGVLEINFV